MFGHHAKFARLRSYNLEYLWPGSLACICSVTGSGLWLTVRINRRGISHCRQVSCHLSMSNTGIPDNKSQMRTEAVRDISAESHPTCSEGDVDRGVSIGEVFAHIVAARPYAATGLSKLFTPSSFPAITHILNTRLLAFQIFVDYSNIPKHIGRTLSA
ncbi:hypothetical protein BASA60_002846, partial [Batrachochytrium salamandrivorans]